jgi:outer membrane lipoprotein carrier protein
MRLMTLLLFVLAAAPSPRDVVAKVQATYEKAGNLEATFTQTYHEKLRGKTRSESGKLWATTDGRVRWEYREPVKKYFISDGKTAWFYEPENAQVTEFDKFEDSELSSALRFLLGKGKLTERFDVKECEKNCKVASAGEHVVALWPKEKLPGVDHILFVVDPASFRVTKSVVIDPLGNRTEYAFTDVTFGATPKDTLFHFEIPDGVQRLRGTLGG